LEFEQRKSPIFACFWGKIFQNIILTSMTPPQKGRDAISLSISGAKLLKMTSNKRPLLAETAKKLPKWGEIADDF